MTAEVKAIVSQILETALRGQGSDTNLSDQVLGDIAEHIYEKYLRPLEINAGGKLWSALKELPQATKVIVDGAVRSTRGKRGNSMDITSGPVLRDIASDVFEKHYIPSLLKLLKDKPSTAKTSLLIRITPTSPARVVGLLASIVTLIMFVYWLLGKL